MDPRPAEGSLETLYLSTSLVIIGVFVSVLRERFKESTPMEPQLNWVWRPITDQTDIFIESGYNTELEARLTRPGIWIDREQNVYTKSGIGSQDQISAYIPQGLEKYHAFGETDVTIHCTSPNRGESMMLGSVVQDFVQMSSFIIERFFGFRRISDVVLNRTGPHEEDDQLFTSPVQFRVFYETRWATRPIAALLQQMSLVLVDKDHPDDVIRQILLNYQKPPVNPVS